MSDKPMSCCASLATDGVYQTRSRPAEPSVRTVIPVILDGVKTAVSIPDDVFEEADRAAARLGWSRSQLYTTAVRAFLGERGEDPVTAALNALADELAAEPAVNAGRDLVDRAHSEW